jgi:hypothetical protein
MWMISLTIVRKNYLFLSDFFFFLLLNFTLLNWTKKKHINIRNNIKKIQKIKVGSDDEEDYTFANDYNFGTIFDPAINREQSVTTLTQIQTDFICASIICNFGALLFRKESDFQESGKLYFQLSTDSFYDDFHTFMREELFTIKEYNVQTFFLPNPSEEQQYAAIIATTTEPLNNIFLPLFNMFYSPKTTENSYRRINPNKEQLKTVLTTRTIGYLYNFVGRLSKPKIDDEIIFDIKP